jgi:ribosomal protein L11 methylase PrmA
MDVGCGSSEVIGLDIGPLAVEASRSYSVGS